MVNSNDVPGAAPQYRVYAVKYAERDARRPEHFIGGDPHGTSMPMDYFVWAIVGDDDLRFPVAFPGLDGIAVRLDGSDGGDDHIRR